MPGPCSFPSPDPGKAVVWSEDVANRVLELVAGGMPLYRVPSVEGMPSIPTLYEWRADPERAEWAKALAHARASRADRLADEGLSIVDSVDPDSPFGSARVSRSREQANYRRWLAGCLDRETYGERPPTVAVQVNSQVAVAFGRLGGAQDGE